MLKVKVRKEKSVWQCCILATFQAVKNDDEGTQKEIFDTACANVAKCHIARG
ncbi:MAG: hypothetical protein PHP62_00450 [Candidatus Moranbacteria bacterium]|nr:hypothetical protein [Candidatus Moranbacteria bacterium]